jgi:hypothetical protein
MFHSTYMLSITDSTGLLLVQRLRREGRWSYML